jgi:hypothetical protein
MSALNTGFNIIGINSLNLLIEFHITNLGIKTPLIEHANLCRNMQSRIHKATETYLQAFTIGVKAGRWEVGNINSLRGIFV